MVKKTTERKVVEAEEVKTDTSTHDEADSKGTGVKFNSGQIIWGLVLILLGVLILLDNLGFISLQWTALWRLWPLLIILAGVATLDIKGRLNIFVTVGVLLLVGGLMMTALTGNIDNISRQEEKSGRITDIDISRESNVDRAEIAIDAGAGSVNISDHRGRDLVTGSLSSAITKLTQESKVEGGVQQVELSLSRGFQAWSINPSNSFDLTLSRRLPVSLNIDAGAASVKADLEKVQVESVNIEAGASSVWLKLGDRIESSEVDVDTGVSSVEILVPDDAGVELHLDAGLSSDDLPGDLEEVRDGLYRSKGFSGEDVKFVINADVGLSSFKLARY